MGQFFRAGLTLEALERFLEDPGPAYVLEITSDGGALELADRLTNATAAGDTRVSAVDYRGKIDFLADGKPLLTLYIGRQGEIVWGTEILKPRSKKDAWQMDVLDTMEFHL
jgi:hypothetical protein